MMYRNYNETSSYKNLEIDCSKCFGFCCVALYFSTIDNFPQDKIAGQPCKNLKDDFTCKIHKDLRKKNLKGCINYDCFGAGQKVAQNIYKNVSWKNSQEKAQEMYDVFVVVKNLQEMIWYLCDSFTFTESEDLRKRINEMIIETQSLTNLCAKKILEINVEEHRTKVNYLLKEVIANVIKKINPKRKNDEPLGFDFIGKDLRNKDLIGANLVGALLIGSNLQHRDLSGAIVIGADMRDADIRGCNAENTMYLTQSQINSARGNSKTKLPLFIKRPSHWEE
ncbi:MAG: pentapeptide repeat-containing protein [Terrisporobacter othiniensis]|uniref:pentapeptide repeat-containing protein n=1 Tax=Terrisporobacter petrolearius TaxID=1460447 RepID=UPI0029088034|nr:pentapeptide repeat-containing protein [Terrisporobacter othiniensis]